MARAAFTTLVFLCAWLSLPSFAQDEKMDCDKPPAANLKVWRECKSLRFLTFNEFDWKAEADDRLNCYRCTFRKLKLHNGKFPLGLRESRFRDARIEGADLRGGFFRGVKARAMRIKNSNLENTDWITAYLPESRFEKVNFANVKFAGADLSGAEFVDCDLSGADLRQALLVRTRFRGVKTDAHTKWPEGYRWLSR